MSYKISGTLSDAARIVVIKESDWSIESNTNKSAGSYEIDTLVSGTKWMVARKSDGETLAFGNVDSVYYAPQNTGVFIAGVSSGNTKRNIIDYITISTTGNATDMGDLNITIEWSAGTSNSINNRAVVGTGHVGSDYIGVNYFNIVNFSSAAFFGNLTMARSRSAACSNGTSDRGVWFAGNNGNPVNVMDYITISTTGNGSDFGDLTQTMNGPAATSNLTGDRAVAGNYAMDYITISTTGNASDFGNLTVSRSEGCAGCSNGTNNRGVIGGGVTSGNVIDYITITSLGNATDFGDLTLARFKVGAASNATNNRGVWGGGDGGGVNTYCNILDYIAINSIGNAVDFGNLTVGRLGVCATSNA